MTDPRLDDQAAMPAAADASADLPAAGDAAGLDPAPLDRLFAWIAEERLDIRSLLIVRQGRLAFERYGAGLDRDSRHDVFSIANTVTSLLFGILADEGRIGLTDRLADRLAGGDAALASALADKQRIELGHLLSMSSGLAYTLTGGADPLVAAPRNRLLVALTAKPTAPPGTVFNYTVTSPVLVGAAVAAAAGMPEERFAEERLFRPLGMRNHAWEGADGTGAVSGGWGLRLRAMDMAKLGVMMLRGGGWQGRQLVPASWIREMTTPSATAPDYGRFCWIGHIVESEPEFGAMGFAGQYITILPERHSVVVMTSMLPVTGGVRDAVFLQIYRRMVKEFILPAMA